MSSVTLREVRNEDLAEFFEHQLDAEAIHMAAFASDNPSDRDRFTVRWNTTLRDEHIVKRTILMDDQVAGHILSFDQFGKPSVSYWIDKRLWGRGIATAALREFLVLIETRPLYARCATDNVGSRRVLEKCGFVVFDRDRGFSMARNAEVDELILRLDAD